MNLLRRILPRADDGSRIDLSDPRTASNPFPHYERLRRDGPVRYLARHRSWIVLGHKEVKTALDQPRLFSNAPYGHIDSVLLAADPPRHSAVRRLVSRHFSAATLAQLAEVARLRAEAALAPEMEVVEDYAGAVSRAVAAALIGFGEAELAAIAAAAARVAAGVEPLSHLIAELDRIAPQAKLFGALDGADADGVGDAELRSLVRLLWLAATTTTERLIAHSVLRLLRHPQLRSTLAADRSLVAPFLEEVMRLHPPEHMLPRRAAAAVELGGVDMAAGDHVWLCVAAANRDRSAYDRPDELRLDRRARRHFAFGGGVHQCLGAPLARRVAAAAVDVLLDRAPGLRPLEPLDAIEWFRTMTALAPARLRVGT